MKTTKQFVDELNKKFPNKWEVLEDYKGCKNKIKMLHLPCGHTGLYAPTNVLSGNGCGVCTGSQIEVGVNDINTTDNDVAKLFYNKEDRYKYSKYSNHKVLMMCPDCKHLQEKTICNVVIQGFSCEVCGSGISYPNRFLRYFLEQLPVNNVEYEFNREWTNKKQYDGYFEYKNNKYIIEMDSEIHETEKNIINDKYKDNIIKKYDEDIILIRLKFKKIGYSYKDQIVKAINNSILSNLFDLSMINWDDIDSKCSTNLEKEVWNYFNNNYKESIYILNEICSKFNINRSTAKNYLKHGAELNQCLYSKEIMRKCSNNAGYKNNKLVKREDGYVFKSYTLAAKCLGYESSAYITYAIKSNTTFEGYYFYKANKLDVENAMLNNMYIDNINDYMVKVHRGD